MLKHGFRLCRMVVFLLVLSLFLANSFSNEAAAEIVSAPVLSVALEKVYFSAEPCDDAISGGCSCEENRDQERSGSIQ